jgi:hypothetical protein
LSQLRHLHQHHRPHNHLRHKIIRHEDNALLIQPRNVELINVLTKDHSAFCTTWFKHTFYVLKLITATLYLYKIPSMFFVFCRAEMALAFTGDGQFNRNPVALYIVSTCVYPRLLFWKTQCIQHVNTILPPNREHSPFSVTKTKRLWLCKKIIAVHCKNQIN